MDRYFPVPFYGIFCPNFMFNNFSLIDMSFDDIHVKFVNRVSIRNVHTIVGKQINILKRLPSLYVSVISEQT
jgi:hypothetical protein